MAIIDLQNEQDMLPANFQLGPHHVVIGSRNYIYTHYPGNVRFQNVVNSHLDRYRMSKTKHEKSEVISEVITRFLQEGASKTGGFVRYDRKSGRWCKVGYFFARQRTSQAFRDALHETYKSSKVNKRKNKQLLGLVNREVTVLKDMGLLVRNALHEQQPKRKSVEGRDGVSSVESTTPTTRALSVVGETKSVTDAKLYNLLETAISTSIDYDDINPLEPSPIKVPSSFGTNEDHRLWRSVLLGAESRMVFEDSTHDVLCPESAKTKQTMLSFPEYKCSTL